MNRTEERQNETAAECFINAAQCRREHDTKRAIEWENRGSRKGPQKEAAYNLIKATDAYNAERARLAISRAQEVKP